MKIKNIFRFLKRTHTSDIVKFILLLGLMVWLLTRGADTMGYNWQWHRVWRYLFTADASGIHAGPLIQGLMVTFQITCISTVLSFAIGLATAIFRLSDSLIANLISRLYLELIRNTPLLIQLFFIYFVIGPIFNLERFTAAILALSLFEGAYASEIFRSGIVSIHKGMWEAAYSLGLTKKQTYRFIILPLAIRRIIPPLTGQAVSLVKDSALVSTIAVYDLAMRAQAIIAETYLAFEIWFIVAAIYLMVTLSISTASNWLEHQLRIDG